MFLPHGQVSFQGAINAGAQTRSCHRGDDGLGKGPEGFRKTDKLCFLLATDQPATWDTLGVRPCLFGAHALSQQTACGTVFVVVLPVASHPGSNEDTHSWGRWLLLLSRVPQLLWRGGPDDAASFLASVPANLPRPLLFP